MKLTRFHNFLLLTATLLIAGCGTHPAALRSSQDIRITNKETDRIDIAFLPVQEYPLLSKFTNLHAVSFHSIDGSGGTDEKLKALSKLRFGSVRDVNLLNSPRVTDVGIRYLANIGSITLLGLEGTSITDDGLDVLASHLKLRGINVANCPKTTKVGLIKLAQLPTLQELSFSSEALTQNDVIEVLRNCKSVSWFGVVDTEAKLEASALQDLGRKQGIRVVVSRMGVLQYMRTNANTQSR